MAVIDSKLSRIKRLMDLHNLDLLVAYSNGLARLGTFDHVWYITSYRPMSDSAAIVSKLGEDLQVVVTPEWDRNRAVNQSGIEADRIFVSNEFNDSLLGIVVKTAEDVKLRHVGITGVQPNEDMWNNICSVITSATRKTVYGSFETKIVQSNDIIEEASRTRDQIEIAATRKAVEIAEEGYRTLLETARPGLPEFKLAAEVHKRVRELGADDNFQSITASQYNHLVHQPTNRLLCDGDIILAEISPSYRGVFTQICRTVVVGPVSQLLAEKYEKLIDSYKAGFEACLPGNKVGKIAQSVNERLVAAGYAEYCRPPFMRSRGHGLGIGSPGELEDDNERILESGMMFVLHPNQFLPETGYLMCGEPVLVTNSKPEQLTQRHIRIDSTGPEE